MRPSTTTPNTAIVASALILALATTPTPASAGSASATPLQLFNLLSTPCNHCLVAGSKNVSPTCDNNLLDTTNAPEAMTPTEKACYCPLASAGDTTWTQACSLLVCNSTEISTLESQLSAAKDAVCSSKTTGPGLAGSGASGALAVGGTTIATGALFAVVSAAVLLL